MSKNILEKLQDTNPEGEIWWDSSPLVYSNWANGVIKSAPENKKKEWTEQLERLFNPAKPENMFFRSVTTNPPLSYIAIKENPAEWAKYVKELIQEDGKRTVEELFWLTYKEIVKRGALMLKPLWEKSARKYGYISGQVDPRFVYDYEAMKKQAMEIADISPNIIVKCPGSKEGYQLIEELTALGIGTNNTTSFCVPQYIECMNAVTRGLKKAKENGVDTGFRFRSVITHMADRYGSLGDLSIQAKARGIELSETDIKWADLAIFKRAYFWGLERKHPSKMLMCSMRLGPAQTDGSTASWHIEKIAGSNSVYTCPPKYIAQLMENEDKLKPFDPNAINEQPPKAVIEKLLKIPYFRDSYEIDGLKPDEFGKHAAFIATASEFSAATRGMVDFVAQVKQGYL